MKPRPTPESTPEANAKARGPAQVPAIRFEGVSKSFGDQVVLDGIDLQIERGTVNVFLGPSGTGKSVLLRCLVGLLRPDRGRIEIFGESITDLDPDRARDRKRLFAIRRHFGMLFQDGALFDDMSVGENVAFPMRVHGGWAEAEIQQRVAEKLAQVGLAGSQSKQPSELSGGMRKRAAFARAVALDPPILLCDEPASGLDPVMAACLDELILELHRRSDTTFVVISHDVAEARTIADNLGMLAGGKLVAFGPRDELIAHPPPALRQFFQRDTEGPIQPL